MGESRMTHHKAVTGALFPGPVFGMMANTTPSVTGRSLAISKLTTTAIATEYYKAPVRMKLEKVVVMRTTGNVATTTASTGTITVNVLSGTTAIAYNQYSIASMLTGTNGSGAMLIDVDTLPTKAQTAAYLNRPHLIWEAGEHVSLQVTFANMLASVKQTILAQPYFREWTGIERCDK